MAKIFAVLRSASAIEVLSFMLANRIVTGDAWTCSHHRQASGTR
jgi:hypothetical protein